MEWLYGSLDSLGIDVMDLLSVGPLSSLAYGSARGMSLLVSSHLKRAAIEHALAWIALGLGWTVFHFFFCS